MRGMSYYYLGFEKGSDFENQAYMDSAYTELFPLVNSDDPSISKFLISELGDDYFCKIWANIGNQFFYYQNAFEVSANCYKVVQETCPSANALVSLGLSRFFQNSIHEAFYYFDKAIEYDSLSGVAHYQRGRCYFIIDSLDLAMADFEYIRKYDYNNVWGHPLVAMGIVYYKKKNFKEAITYLETGLKYYQTNSLDAYFYLALAKHELLKEGVCDDLVMAIQHGSKEAIDYFMKWCEFETNME